MMSFNGNYNEIYGELKEMKSLPNSNEALDLLKKLGKCQIS